MKLRPDAVLRILLFGGFRLYVDDIYIDALDTPRQQSLLAYLLLQRSTAHPRALLARIFWPDSTAAQQRTNLRQLLHTLRQRLPDVERYLAIDERSVRWRADAPFTLDVAAFEQEIAAAEGASAATRIAALSNAVTAYTGDLLPTFYEEWILRAREGLSQQYVAALEALIDLHGVRGEIALAVERAQQLLHHDPVHEATYRRLMNLHAQDGDRATALRVYHTCVTMLAQELGVTPAVATHDLYLRLLGVEGGPSAAEAAAARPAASSLVGRETEWAALQACWREVTRGHAQLLVIAGEAGIGKTRLAEEMLSWAEYRDVTTARTRAYAAAGSLAYAPIIEWLRSQPHRAAIAAMAPDELAELARLLPELVVQHPDLPRPVPLSGPVQQRRLFDVLARAAAPCAADGAGDR